VNFAVSGPITDWLRFRLAASKSDQTEGYFRNAYPNNGGYDSEGQRRMAARRGNRHD
jgi:hypothetical protein